MEYFTKEEAEQCYNELNKYIGTCMKYSPNEDCSKIIDIQIQETPHEISSYGKILSGYLVIIMFEKHSGLPPALFCAFNGLPPIVATHSVLTPSRKSQLITLRTMKGKWHYSKDTDVLNIVIEDEISIDGIISGSKYQDTFSSNGHWFGDYLFIFTSNPSYIMHYSNENEISLALIPNPNYIDGKVIWSKILKRVQ